MQGLSFVGERAETAGPAALLGNPAPVFTE